MCAGSPRPAASGTWGATGTPARRRARTSGTLTVAGAHGESLASSLDNQGTITQTGAGPLTLRGSAVTLTNEANATDTIQTGGELIGGTVDNQGTIAVAAGAGQTFTDIDTTFDNLGGMISVTSGAFLIANDETATGRGTSTGGAFDVSIGAVLDISGLGTLTGTYNGTGGGVVQLTSSGTIDIGTTGATFDFAPGMFQWMGGTVFNEDTLTNQGTITLAGSQGEDFGPGLLDNTGTIVQTRGQFSLEPNTTILNETGALYNLEADATLGVSGSGQTGANPVLANDGTFQKSAGGGSTTIHWDLDTGPPHLNLDK
jgi:hypothetical protein